MVELGCYELYRLMLTKIKKYIKQNKNKILAGISFSIAGYFIYKYFNEQGSAKLSSFIEAVQQDKVSQVVIEDNTIFFRSDHSEWFRTILQDYPLTNIFNMIKDKDINFQVKPNFIPQNLIILAKGCISTIIMFTYLSHKLNHIDNNPVDLKGSQIDTQTYLNDYEGGEQIKQKFVQTIKFLKNPSLYQEMGARIRRGILFYGPPGTGKTMLARALANQTGCQFIKMVASEFQELYVGVGPKRVRQLFAAARKFKEGCIIFVDEIDALGSRVNHLRANHQTTSTINQFLSEMDGFTPNDKVLVVAATNRVDLVDHAVLRAGRFDIKIHIPLPDTKQKMGILSKLLSKKVGDRHNVQPKMIQFIGESSQNWCGADIQTLVNESLYHAIAQNSQKLEDHHILQAYEQILNIR